MLMRKTIAIILLNIALVCECYITSFTSIAPTKQSNGNVTPIPSIPSTSSPSTPSLLTYKGRKMKLLNYRWNKINYSCEYLFEFLAIIDIIAKIN